MYISISYWNPAKISSTKCLRPCIFLFGQRDFRCLKLQIATACLEILDKKNTQRMTFVERWNPVDPLVFICMTGLSKTHQMGCFFQIAFMTFDGRFRFLQLVFAGYCLSIQYAVTKLQKSRRFVTRKSVAKIPPYLQGVLHVFQVR